MQRPLLRVIVPVSATLTLLFAQVCGAYMSPDEAFGIDGPGIPLPKQGAEPLLEERDVLDESPGDDLAKPAAQHLSQEAPAARMNGALSALKASIFLGVLIASCVGFCLIVGRCRRSSPSSLPSV